MRKTRAISRGHLILAAAAFAFAQGGCQQDSITVTTYHFERCGEMEFVCFCEDSTGARSPASMDMCQSSEDENDCSPFAFVLQTNRDEIGVVDIREQVLVDSDVRVPFNTFAQTGRSPSDIAASPDGRMIYVTHAGDDFVAAFEASGFLGEYLPGYVEIPLMGPSSSIAVSASDSKAYVTLPENSAIAVLNLEDLSVPPEYYELPSAGPAAEEEEVEEAEEAVEEANEAPDDAASDSDAPSDAAEEEEEAGGEDAAEDPGAEDPASDDAAGDVPDVQEMASFIPWVAHLRETETGMLLAVSGSGEEGGVMIFDAARIGEGLGSAFVARVLQGVPVRNFAFTPAGGEPASNFLYAVDRDAGTVHVVDMDSGEEIDTTGGNPLIEAGAIELGGWAEDVIILDLDFGDQTDPTTFTGVFGFIVASNGNLYVVNIRDDHCTAGDCPHHVLRNANDDASSIPLWRGQPSVLLDETQIQYIDQESLRISGYPLPDPEMWAFSPSGPVAGTNYYMYGIAFYAFDPWIDREEPFPDIRRAMSQQWRIGYEDTLPYSAGIGGNIEPEGIMTDAGLPFCAVGVRAGDVLVIDDPPLPLDPSTDCTGYRAEGGMEYKITSARQNELRFEVILNDEGSAVDPMPVEDCFPFAVKYHVRASGQWLVTGTATGYLNDWIVDSGTGECGDREPPCTTWQEEECTLRVGRALEGQYFVNPYIKFIMTAGSLTLHPKMAYVYSAVSGFQPLSLTIARLPSSLKYMPWNRSLYIADSATEGLVEIDLENFLVSNRYF